MKKVWAVSSGSYSDYRVHAIFEDEATADAWAKAIAAKDEDDYSWHSDADTQEFPFIATGTEPKKVLIVDLVQDLWDNGKEADARITERREYPIVALYGPPPPRPVVRFVRAPVHNNKGGRLEIRGKSKEAVLKVYGDEIRMWRSNPVAYRREAKP